MPVIRNAFLSMVLGFLLCGSMLAQPAFRIKNFDKDLEAGTNIGRIIQDKTGNLWISSPNGLIRYDGYAFKAFTSGGNDDVDFPLGSLKGIYPSSDDGIWCLAGNRAYFFDLKTSSYIDVLSHLEKTTARRYVINKLRSYNNGQTWLVTDDGTCIKIDGSSSGMTAAVVFPKTGDDDIDVISFKDATFLFLKNHTYIYRTGKRYFLNKTFKTVLHTKGRYVLLGKDGRLYNYNPKSNKVSRSAPGGLSVPLTSIRQLRNGNILLSSARSQYIYDTAAHKAEVICGGNVSNVAEDSQGRLWMSGADGRLACFSQRDRQRRTYPDVLMEKFHFHEDANGYVWFFSPDGRIYYSDSAGSDIAQYKGDMRNITITNSMTDRRGNMWAVVNSRLCCLTFSDAGDEVSVVGDKYIRNILVDGKQRIWLNGRGERTIRLYDPSCRLLGYLGKDGKIHKSETEFFDDLCSMYQDSRGVLWFGSRGAGLFRLRELSDGTFRIDNYRDTGSEWSLSDKKIYSIAEDRRGRIWLGTHEGGVCCIATPEAPVIKFCSVRNVFGGMPADFYSHVKMLSLCVSSASVLYVATSKGLLVADVSPKDVGRIVFRRHIYDRSVPRGLSSNSLVDVCERADGRMVLLAENGTVDEIVSAKGAADKLEFSPLYIYQSSTNKVAQSVFEYDKSLWVIAGSCLYELPDGNNGFANSYYHNSGFVFTPAAPYVNKKSGRVILGTTNGALRADLGGLRTDAFVPGITISDVRYADKVSDNSVNFTDTLVITPERKYASLTISTNDFSDNSHIVYAYKIDDAEEGWQFMGGERVLTLDNLSVGTHTLRLRSTNSDGIWTDNVRTITVIVTGGLTALIAKVCVVLLLVLVFVVAVLWYKRRKRQPAQADDDAGAVPAVDGQEHEEGAEDGEATLSPDDEAFLRRIEEYIEANISNPDASIEAMASASATSRSSLNRKMKNLKNVSPMEYLRQKRVERACVLLVDTSMSVSEIAFSCGFADPKYFSKYFRIATGVKPSEYKQSSHAQEYLKCKV